MGPKISHATTPITRTSELPTPKNPPEGPSKALVFDFLDFEFFFLGKQMFLYLEKLELLTCDTLL